MKPRPCSGTPAAPFRAAIALVAAVGLLTAFAAGCGTGKRNPVGGPGYDAGATGPCTDGSHRCYGLDYQGCANSNWATEQTCSAACDAMLGCVPCAPSQKFCDGDSVKLCTADGQPGSIVTACAVGACAGGACTDPCGKAASEFSYIGCDYWPTVTANSLVVADSHFAVAVANPNSMAVDVQISRGGMMVQTAQVPPNGLSTITLPWVMELKNASMSDLVVNGAYKLSASLPVTVYQFNPVEYEVMNCGSMGGSSCFTYTNDASLLLPANTLTQHYIVISRATLEVQDIQKGGLFGGGSTSYVAQSPGFLAVVGTQPGVTKVDILFTAPTMAGQTGKFAAYQKGQTGTFMVNQGDVLQIFSQVPPTCNATFSEKYSSDPLSGDSLYGYCDLPSTDLTGSEITADKKIAVFGGHNCAFIPYNRWACDHLEQEMLPLEGWGKRYLSVHSQRHPNTIPDLWRVVSGANNNTITFTPAGVHAPVMLNRGQWLEFESSADFEVNGSAALAVAQYMAGQDYQGFQQGGSSPGDPAMSLVVPVEQYRTSYIFLAPVSYTENYVNVTAPKGQAVTLDGKVIDPNVFVPFGAGDFAAARIAIPAGTHNISCAQQFGIQVYGLAPYTSYMYPGGLDINQINIQ